MTRKDSFDKVIELISNVSNVDDDYKKALMISARALLAWELQYEMGYQNGYEDGVFAQAIKDGTKDKSYGKSYIVINDKPDSPFPDKPTELKVEYRPKLGKWREYPYSEAVEGRLVPNFECSECRSWVRDKTEFCPHCGAKMVQGDADQ